MKNKSKLIFISIVLLVLFICLPTQVNGWGSLFGSSSNNNNNDNEENNNDNDDNNNDNIQEQNEENNDNNNIIPETPPPIINKQPIKRKNAVSEDVENNENQAGCTVHFVNSKLDSGKIISQKKILIDSGETEKSLKMKILRHEHRLYPQSIISIFK